MSFNPFLDSDDDDDEGRGGGDRKDGGGGGGGGKRGNEESNLTASVTAKVETNVTGNTILSTETTNAPKNTLDEIETPTNKQKSPSPTTPIVNNINGSISLMERHHINPTLLMDDLTQSLEVKSETEKDVNAPFNLTLKRMIGSCFSGMMLLGSDVSFSKEDACKIMWDKYATAPPSVPPMPIPAIATPFSATDPCISSLVASLPEETPKSRDTDIRKRKRSRRHLSRSVGTNIGRGAIDYSSMQDALERLVSKEDSRPKDTSHVLDESENNNDDSSKLRRLPPLIRSSQGDTEFKAADHVYRKLRAEYRKIRPDVPLYESDTGSHEITSLIMNVINNDKSDNKIQTLREIVWKHGATLKTRHIVWPLILGYLPPDPALWEEKLRRKREEYKELIKIWYDSTLDIIRKAEEYERKTGNKMSIDEDLGLLRQIHVDINRTHPGGFTHMFTHMPILRLLNRLLITWSKAHPKVGYFQGLNEIPTALITVFLMPRLKNWENNDANLNALTENDYFEVEADTYWCLSVIMDQLMVNK